MAAYDSFLRTSLAKYRDPYSTRVDIQTMLAHFTDLSPIAENYTCHDGTTKCLLQLEGTIPVSYKGSCYNIPVSITLMDSHPYAPPHVFVKPTREMKINKGKYVSPNGRIRTPFLRKWTHTKRNLLDLVHNLVDEFSETPPVYSTKSVSKQPTTSARTQHKHHTIDEKSLLVMEKNKRRLCKVCLDDEIQVVFIPCGHYVCCDGCSRQLTRCPICRQAIRLNQRTYEA